jgi:SAM-dependent methyltransferase
MKKELPTLESVEYRFGDARLKPFDPNAGYYAQRVRFDRERLLDMFDAIRGERPTGRVLELAATPYILSAALLDAGYDVTLNGLPVDSETTGAAVLDVNGRRYECALALFDAEDDFPFGDARFDVVVAGEIFEHLYRRPWHMLSEAWRVLADDGVLVLSTPNAESLERLYVWLRRLPSAQGFNPDVPTARHAREYGPREVSMLLESQGFDSVSVWTPSYIRIVGGFPGPLGWFKRRLHRLLKRAAARRSGPLSQRGDTILAVARKNAARPPGEPPEFMLYALADPRSGYNFPHGASSDLS